MRVCAIDACDYRRASAFAWRQSLRQGCETPSAKIIPPTPTASAHDGKPGPRGLTKVNVHAVFVPTVKLVARLDLY